MQTEVFKIINRKDISIVFLKSNANRVAEQVQLMQKRKKINKLSLLFDLDIPEDERFKKRIELLTDVISDDSFDPKILANSVLVFDHGSNCIDNFSLPMQKIGVHKIYDQSGKRKYKLENFNDLFHRYSGSASNIFNHRFLEYNSSYIPAFGTEFSVTPTYVEAGFGRGKSDQSAKTLSTIEAFERYINMYDQKKLSSIRKSFNDMDKTNTLDPESLILHSKKEYSNPHFKLKRYSKKLPIDWVSANDLTRREEIFIPKSAVWFGEKKKNEDSNVYAFETSNGMAIGGDEEEATLYGVYELIERDSFLKAWYGKTLVKEIDWKSVGLHDFEALSEILKKKKQYIHVFDITGETGIPTFWAMLKSEDPNCTMAIYNAAGCNLNPVKAIQAALYEVVTSFPIYEKILQKNLKLKEQAQKVQKSPKNVLNFQDHVLYYANYENSKQFNYLIGRKITDLKICNITSIPLTYKEEFQQVKNLVENKGYRILSINVTPDFLQQEGLVGVKTLVPGLLPMTFGEQYRRIRTDKVSEYNSLFNQDFEQVNLAPHPFP